MNLAIIPARAGSKGLKDKNITLLAGKPLIMHTIEAALGCPFIDKIVVTTDSDRIAEVASTHTQIILRPDKLGVDDVPLAPVIIHAVEKAELFYGRYFKNIFTLQPTSPLRTSLHIREAFKIFNTQRCDSLISVKEELHSIWRVDKGETIPVRKPTVNRQWLKPLYVANGAIFISTREVLTEGDRTGNYVALYSMNRKSSIDIHTKEDMDLAEWYLKSGGKV